VTCPESCLVGSPFQVPYRFPPPLLVQAVGLPDRPLRFPPPRYHFPVFCQERLVASLLAAHHLFPRRTATFGPFPAPVSAVRSFVLLGTTGPPDRCFWRRIVKPLVFSLFWKLSDFWFPPVDPSYRLTLPTVFIFGLSCPGLSFTFSLCLVFFVVGSLSFRRITRGLSTFLRLQSIFSSCELVAHGASSFLFSKSPLFLGRQTFFLWTFFFFVLPALCLIAWVNPFL